MHCGATLAYGASISTISLLSKCLHWDMQARRDEGGDTLVRSLLKQLQEHREDDWVEWVVQGRWPPQRI